SPITFTGAVTQANTPLILATNTTTFSGSISGNVGLTLSGTPVPAVSATLSNTGTIMLTGANSSTSTVTVNGGTLTLAGPSGVLSAITGITVNPGGTLTIDNTAANNTNRINDNAKVTLGGGTINYLGNAGAAFTETVKDLTLGSGNSTISVTSGAGQNAALTFNTLTRTAGA